MYRVFKEAGTPLPRDPNLVDYGFNLEEEVFQNSDAEMGYNQNGVEESKDVHMH